MKNFGEFFNNQIEHAGTVILSRTQNVSEEKLKTAIELIKSVNPNAHIITTPWDDIDGTKILGAMENVTNLELDMLAEAAQRLMRSMRRSTTTIIIRWRVLLLRRTS